MFLPQSNETPLEEKNIPSFSLAGSFPEFLLGGGHFDLGAFAAIQLYKEAMPFFNAVETRAKHFSMIPLRLFDKSTNKFIDSHPVLDLLASPNADVSQIEFLHNLSSYYDITGNVYIEATGRVTRPPLDLIVVSPTLVSFGAVAKRWGLMNIPSTIDISNNFVTALQFLNEDVEGKVRFYTRDQDQEIWRIANFNAGQSIGSFIGTSLAQPLWFELQQYIAGNKTNLSILKRGASLSMAWVNNTGTELTPTQYERIKQEAQNYVGENNAGQTVVLDGLDVKTVSQTNRDMEWNQLQQNMVSRVSNVYDIPLAMLLDSSMTENNLQVSNIQLYDNAVLPLATRLYDELTRFLLPRYPNSENLEFRFNENDIPALRNRIIESAKQQKDVGVNSTNELREILGDRPLSTGEGGDNVLVPSTMIPLGMAGDAQSALNQLPESQDEQPKSAFDEFYNVLIHAVDEKGDRVYSEQQIIDIALHRGLLNGDQ